MSTEPKKKIIAMMLCLFLGVVGAHRFYLGYTGIGIAQLLTGGGCGIWYAVDQVMIALGKLPDANGDQLV